MSMMSQKLNREGTVAYEQLEELQKSVAELQKLNKSDLYKLAKEISVGSELTPITKSWHIDFNRDSYREILFGERYFGHFTVVLGAMEVAGSDNDYRRSYARLSDGGNIVTQLVRVVHGDDILSFGTDSTTILGVADRMTLHRFHTENVQLHSLTVSFTGYKLGVPSQTELFNLVTNAGYKLADNAGNIISAP